MVVRLKFYILFVMLNLLDIQDPKIDKRFVPNLEMHFDSMDDAFQFYQSYAHLAGFDVKKNRKRNSGRGQDFECSFAGMHKNSPGAERIRAKTTKRKNCKAMVCAVKTKDGDRIFFKKIVLEHNHVLTESPSITKHMKAHKLKDKVMDEFVDVMHRARVKHVNVMNILRESVGGSKKLPFTERDIQSR